MVSVKRIMKTIIRTNMCMLYRPNGEILVQERRKCDWPGLTFPGGHVEPGEGEEEACRREMREETGLSPVSLECLGDFVWDWEEVHRARLFRSSSWTGALSGSREGEVFWCPVESLRDYPFSGDFEKILIRMCEGLPFEERIRRVL